MVAKPNKKKVNALLESLGIELKAEDFAPGKTPKEEFKNALPSRKYSKDQEMIQVESTLLGLHKMPKDWYLRHCKGCKESFYTNYYFVAYCGDQCRARELKKIGIIWVNRFDEAAKWQGRTPPMIIPPEALAVMRFLVQRADQETPELVEKQEQHQQLSVSSLKQNPGHTEHQSPNENVQVHPDNTDELLSEPIASQTEDDFLSILDALDV